MAIERSLAKTAKHCKSPYRDGGNTAGHTNGVRRTAGHEWIEETGGARTLPSDATQGDVQEKAGGEEWVTKRVSEDGLVLQGHEEVEQLLLGPGLLSLGLLRILEIEQPGRKIVDGHG